MEPAEFARSYRLEAEHWWFASRRRLVAALLAPHLPADPHRRVLDVGCGTGGNLKLLQTWGRVTGIDINALPLSFARHRNGSLAQGSALHLPFAGQTFGLVAAFDVLYHRQIASDRQALAELRRVLAPGGWLVITDSALPLLWSAHDRLYHTRRRYTLPHLQRRLQAAGLHPVFCSYANMVLLPLLLPTRLLMRRVLTADFDLHPPPRWLNRALMSLRNLETAWLSRGHTLPVGSSLVCLAQRDSL